MTYEPMEEFEQCGSVSDWHAQFTIQLGELIESGIVDFDDGSWSVDWYSEDQGERIWEKFTNRYYLREISMVPVSQWKRELLRKLNEIMPKYKKLYEVLADSPLLFADQNDYGKSRDVYSEFPATQLQQNMDFANNAKDREYEHVHLGNIMDKAEQLAKRYNDVDVMILNDLESLFMCLMFPTVPSM